MSRPIKKAKGTLNPNGQLKAIAIHFSKELFEKIATEAVNKDRSFAEQARLYIGRGMERSSEDG